MSKTHERSCYEDGKACVHTGTCRKNAAEVPVDAHGVNICFVTARPPLVGREARNAWGDGAHCNSGFGNLQND
jgi:hypothetical protein